MADLDTLRARGIPYRALVDGEGVAVSGTDTIAELAIEGMAPICQVDELGDEVVGDEAVASLRSRGIPFFCEVDELGVADSGHTLRQLADRGIPGYAIVGLDGIAQSGTLTFRQLADRGIASFCPVDEDGLETGLGTARMTLVGRTIPENSANGTTIGTLGTVNTTGTAAFTLVDNAGGRFSLTGALLKVANGLLLDYETASSHSITVSVSGVAPAIANRTFVILVTDVDDTAPIIESASSVANVEGTVLAHPLTANETVTWTKTGGVDTAQFTLTGNVLSWATTPTRDRETPLDANVDNAYLVQVTATDAALNATNQIVTVTVTDVDEIAPGITSLDTASVAELATLTHALTANETVTWSIFGGADAAHFLLSGSTLSWAAPGYKDYEAFGDADANNAYVVIVRATDTTGNTTNQTITVTVTDVSEGGGGTAGQPVGLLLALTRAS